MTLRAILEDLHAAGLDLVADAPFDKLQNPRRSIEEVNIGGLALGRLTIHQLPTADALALFKQVAELQYNVAVIRAFAPLPRRVNPAVPTTGYDDVKRVALARLTIQNIPSIQVDWSLYGPKLAQVALTVGADDVDGVSPEDDTGQGAAGRRSRRSAAISARPARSRWSATAGSRRWLDDGSPRRRGVSQRASARLWPRSVAALFCFASTCRPRARRCCTTARSTSA